MSVTLDGVLQTLTAMERYFQGGSGWGKGQLHDNRTGRKCLVGAVTSVRATSSGGASWVPSEEIVVAQHYIEMAVREQRHGEPAPFGIIQSFNDTRHSYQEIAAVIERAKQLAAIDHAQARIPVIDLTPVSPSTPLALPPPTGSGFFAGLLPTPAPLEPVLVSPWVSTKRPA